jgi:hypothetical protein
MMEVKKEVSFITSLTNALENVQAESFAVK